MSVKYGTFDSHTTDVDDTTITLLEAGSFGTYLLLQNPTEVDVFLRIGDDDADTDAGILLAAGQTLEFSKAKGNYFGDAVQAIGASSGAKVLATWR